MRVRTRAVAAVAAGTALVAVVVGGALPARADDDRVRALVAVDGTLRLTASDAQDCEYWPDAYDAAVTPVLTQLDLSYLDVAGPECVGTVLAVVGTRLTELSVDRYSSGSGWTDTHRSRDLGRGWGGMRILVDTSPRLGDSSVGHLYALGTNGTLYRYRFVRSDTGELGVRSAGSYPGLGVVKTLTVGSASPTLDTLLGTTAAGQLVQLRVPRTTTMTVTSSRLRERTWQGFEHLLSAWPGSGGTCPGPSRLDLSGIDDDTGLQTTYAVGPFAGLATSITPVGVPSVVPEPYDAITSGQQVYSNAC